MATKVGTADIIRVLGTYNQKELEAKYGAEMAAVITALTQSAWAANNSVNVGMTETAEVLNPMLPQPGTEQIYTTQPQWDFDEGESLQLGSTWTDTSVTPNKVYPIPSLVPDKGYDAAYAAWEEAEEADKPAAWAVVLQHQHVVFPVWQWDTTEEEYRYKPMPITFRHNCNYFGGGLVGFDWQEVSLTSGSSVTVTGDAQTGFTASVPTSATVAVGTWVRLTYTESDASKSAYGYVSAVGEGEVTVTVVGTCGETVTKVELYKPLQG